MIKEIMVSHVDILYLYFITIQTSIIWDPEYSKDLNKFNPQTKASLTLVVAKSAF